LKAYLDDRATNDILGDVNMVGIIEFDSDLSNMGLERSAGMESLDITTLVKKTFDLSNDWTCLDWWSSSIGIVVDAEDHLSFVVTGEGCISTNLSCVSLAAAWHERGKGQDRLGDGDGFSGLADIRARDDEEATWEPSSIDTSETWKPLHLHS
jgi:hypothetical protein